MPTVSLPRAPAWLAATPSQQVVCSPTDHPPEADNHTASVDSLMPDHFRRRVARPVSYYALFQGMAASKPTSWLSKQPNLL